MSIDMSLIEFHLVPCLHYKEKAQNEEKWLQSEPASSMIYPVDPVQTARSERFAPIWTPLSR